MAPRITVSSTWTCRESGKSWFAADLASESTLGVTRRELLHTYICHETTDLQPSRIETRGNDSGSSNIEERNSHASTRFFKLLRLSRTDSVCEFQKVVGQPHCDLREEENGKISPDTLEISPGKVKPLLSCGCSSKFIFLVQIWRLFVFRPLGFLWLSSLDAMFGNVFCLFLCVYVVSCFCCSPE